MKLPALVVLLIAAEAALAGDAPAPVDGLWIHHADWQMAPAEINEDGNIHKFANAAVLNFCPNGAFRMATGVIYQSTKSPDVQIGASDGLAIYRGTWVQTANGIAVEYQLVSAEFADLLHDPVAAAKRTATVEMIGRKLGFPFTNIIGKVYPLSFIPAARYEKRVGDEFVECVKSQAPQRTKDPR